METLPLLISLVPTFVLLGLVGVFFLRDHMGPVIGVGVAVGVVVCIPVYLMETVIEDFGAGLPGLYERAFVQQVLGASVSEELAIFAGFVLTFRLFQKTGQERKRSGCCSGCSCDRFYHNRKCHGGDCVANTHVNRRQSFTFNCRWTRQFAVDDGLFCLKVPDG